MGVLLGGIKQYFLEEGMFFGGFMNKDIDLNLLKVLVLLERHRQLKPVANALGKSEASISKYLARLRIQLEDDLFIRHAHHFEPTDYLNAKLSQIQASLEQLESCLIKDIFEPRNYDKNITICLPQSAQYAFGHLLLSDLMTLFPKAKIHISNITDHTIEDILEDKVDMQLHYFNENHPKSIFQQFIGYAPPIIVVPEELGIKDLATACQLPFFLLAMTGWKDKKQITEIALEQNGLYINTAAMLSNITSILNAIKFKNGATILLDYQKQIEGFQIIPVPETMFSNGFHKVVIQIKQTHRYNAFHQCLIEAISHYISD